ncbi:hypothetical protein N2152v2_004461 [Parachlorella kessleri]
MGRALVATSRKRQIVSGAAQMPRDLQYGNNLDAQAERELAGAVVHTRGGNHKRKRDEASSTAGAITDLWDKLARQPGVRMADLVFTEPADMPKRFQANGGQPQQEQLEQENIY